MVLSRQSKQRVPARQGEGGAAGILVRRDRVEKFRFQPFCLELEQRLLQSIGLQALFIDRNLEETEAVVIEHVQRVAIRGRFDQDDGARPAESWLSRLMASVLPDVIVTLRAW